jgi:hypothetical protein
MRYLLTAAIAATTILLVGCGPTCKELRADYEEARAAELPAQSENGRSSDAGADDVPLPHLAVGLRTSMLEDLATRTAKQTLEAVLSVSDALEVAGDSPVAVETLPNLDQFRLDRPEGACPHCFQISGKLSGTMDVRIPALGKRTVPMDGEFQFVAPLTLAPGEKEGTTDLQLDLSEAARHNAPLVAVTVTDLRNSWARMLQEILSDALADTLLGQLEPVTLASFDTPEFGLTGVSMQPAGLQITSDGKAVQALLTTDLPLANPPSAAALGSAANPTGRRNVALAVPTRIVGAGIARGFRSGDVSRNYELSGEASAEGPVRVTLGDIETSPSPSNDAGAEDSPSRQPLSFGFRAWHLEEGGPCYWFDGEATGEIRADEGRVSVGLDDVTFTDTSRTGLSLAVANWRSASFLKSGSQILGASLNEGNIDLPGGPYGFSELGLDVTDGIVSLSAAVAPKKNGNEQESGTDDAGEGESEGDAGESSNGGEGDSQPR